MSDTGQNPVRPADGAAPGRVLVVGDLVTDVVAVLGAPVAAGSDTPAAIRFTGGGQAANTAAWLAALGVPVTLVATVGDDDVGSLRLAELTDAGVDLAVRRCPSAPTGTVIVLAHGGDRSMVADRGANLSLRARDVDDALQRFPDAVHLHLSGYPLLSRQTRPAARHALAAARTRGMSTSVDAASAAPLRAAGAAEFLDWVRGTDLLLANADEAAVLGMADGLPQPGPVRHLVVKRGASGAVWHGPHRPVEAAAQPVPVVDPTGAGDAFAAGLLAAWLAAAPGAAAGPDPADALAHAVRAGAAAVGLVGARPTGKLRAPRR
ncbi:carbohydrate kinase family protein [Micromonospora sp. NBC_01813]|uniref:carbohydrate kinase family protein n=1 Tax=Micromonospora sp. NBC_01813 TaxID=2975988 RepID=UPI002DDB8CE0|nr:carbohydrate kinase family protein [Micromonospora sp. NBC_01813]WSA11496.1 carbohydrate kinase family protein [Micromonospora sp. NBC_01813]